MPVWWFVHEVIPLFPAKEKMAKVLCAFAIDQGPPRPHDDAHVAAREHATPIPRPVRDTMPIQDPKGDHHESSWILFCWSDRQT